MQGKGVLITGAAGFIGTRLVNRLIRLGYRCMGLDDLSSGCPPLAPHENLEFKIQDVCESEGVRKAFRQFLPETVVHLAAIHHIPTCERNAPRALEVNVVGCQVVLEAAELAGCRKFILASTGGVYDWQEGPLAEETPVRATDIYTLSKITNERQVALWSASTGTPVIVARIFNTIGQNDPNAHLIPDILRQLNTNEKRMLVRMGNLHTRRDFIYVDDTAACLAMMVEAEGLHGVEFFNVGTGREYAVRSIVEGIARIKGCSLELQVDPRLARRVDRSCQLADITKTASTLNWQPRYSLEEALRLSIGQECQ
jgi:UDP-glucose 4-epimerase